MTCRASLLTTVAVVVTLALALASGSTLEGQAARGKTALMKSDQLKEQAPATFKANFDTSLGAFVVETHRDWAPLGADRFYNLVKAGFYDGNRFFYVTPRVATWGIHGDPEVAKAWIYAKIPNDPPHVQSNKRGYAAFAQSNGRKTQTFINILDNLSFDSLVSPFGQVVSGMNIVEKLYAGYGEMYPTGNAPTMTHMLTGGNAYLEKEYPKMDYIKTATIAP